VVAPATAYDAKGLLKSAVRDDNPVLYFENKFLYRRIKEEIDPATEVLVPLGEARTVRQGSAAVIITYGAMLHAALEAADGLAAEGIEVTILDLRSLQPLDIEAILESVRRTNRVVIVHEANLTGGIGGEIAALISEYAFEELDAPIKRVAGLDTPTPYAPVMEEYWRPNAAKIARAVHDVVRF
ncbi:MAG TPA: transketolase C-terminal domain-containing protein, partial [bacterium]|nr:transketolase C-terminal domain-containing protein [bacterium]